MNSTKIISIISEKGGVGKTTTTFILACGLKKLNKKVLVLDLDKQCNLSSTCGYKPDDELNICDIIYNVTNNRNIDYSKAIRHAECGIDYIPSCEMLDSINSQISQDFDYNYVLKRILAKEEFAVYDYILCDNKTAIDILTQNALNASCFVLLPIDAGIYSFDGISRIISKVNSLQATTNPELKMLGILLNKSKNTKVGKAVKEATESLYNDVLFKTVVPAREAQVEDAISNTVGCVDIKSNTLGSIYMELAKEVLKRSEA